AARLYGLRVRAIALENINDFRYIALPAIVHWEFNHFLVVEHWSTRIVGVVDPSSGRRRISAQEFENSFTGVVLQLEPGVHFSRRSRPAQLSLWTYLRSIFRLPGFIAQLLGASLFLQMLGLVLPFLTKVFVDQVIPAGLENIMLLLGLGVLVIVLAQTVTALLRVWLLIYLQARLDMQMMLGFFEHLLSLSYRFFQLRSSGDLLARMTSNIAIRDMLTNQMISTLLDGGTVVVYLFILLWFSPPIALCALIAGLLQVTLLLLGGRLIRDLTRRDLMAQGIAQGYMTEALIGIATIKAAGAEQRAFHRWSNLFFEHLNISVRRDSFASVLETLMGGLRLLAPLLLLWVGTLEVLHSAMTVGTMLSLNALAATFLAPFASLTNNGQQLQQVRAHFERIVDVVEAESEQDIQTTQAPPVLTGHVELRHISFRYDPNSPWVLRDITLCIRPGQKVALVGRTGSGKSTLGKLLLGLYLPTEGEILYDDSPLCSLNYQAVRSQFGVVLQESALFSGSIRENIALNNPDMDLEQVMQAAQAAAIHEDIVRMPMGYETMIAEGGSAISGGQRQRLSIARALANRPSIILFDEATSHLDVVTEQIVERNLQSLDCTHIVIAHRLSTIRNADLILVLDEGTIVERGAHQALLALGGHYARLVQSQFSSEAVSHLSIENSLVWSQENTIGEKQL
ncbi:MAG TPA: peptidase domain-containing ABC transporter, partial [Ktedonobacteraceae bacterium]|nr:peptidase domain-containing ABC transporter [Ktedonobacteraceae bacterium]